jgi:hypothetical protein
LALRPDPDAAVPLPPAAEEAMQWHVHLAAETPGRRAVVVVVIGLASGLAGWLWSSPLPALGVGFALLNAVAEFLFPVHYRLTQDKAEMRCFLTRRVIAWAVVRRVYRLPDGVKLSPLERPGRREAFRGLFLRFAGNGDEVMSWVSSVRGSVSSDRGSPSDSDWPANGRVLHERG